MNTPTPLLEEYLEIEAGWKKIIETYYPSPTHIYSWARHHRVIRHNDKIVKIQYNNGQGTAIPQEQSITTEYRLLSVVDKKVSELNPCLHDLGQGWMALEIDYIEGPSLQDVINRGPVRLQIIKNLIKEVIRISLCGVIHPQLRGRHVLVKKDDHVSLIDYGGGRMTSPTDALVQNFGIFKPRTSALPYLLKRIFFGGARQVDAKKPPKMLIGTIEHDLKIGKIPKNLTNLDKYWLLEMAMIDAVRLNPDSYLNLPAFSLGPVDFCGSWHWEPIRLAIENNISFEDKKVLVLDAGIGLPAIFAQASGGKVIAYENRLVFRKLAEALADLVQIPLRIEAKPADLIPLVEKADLVICLDRPGRADDGLTRLDFLQTAPDLIISLNQSWDVITAQLKPQKRLTLLYDGELKLYRISDPMVDSRK